MMKKILIVAAAAALLLCGCGRGGRTGATLEVDLTQSYVSEPFNMNGSDVYPIAPVDEGAVVVHYNRYDQASIYLYSSEENTYTEIGKSLKGCPATVVQLPDGRLAALFNIPKGRKGGTDTFDGKDRILEIYGSDMQPEEVLHFDADVPEQILQGNNIAMDADGYWYLYTCDEDGYSAFYVLNPDLTVKGQLDMEDSVCYCDGFVVGRSGKVYCFTSGSSDLYRLDARTMTGEKMAEFKVPDSSYTEFLNGSICELYYSNDKGIYGINEDGTSQPVMNFVNSDIVEFWGGCFSLPNGNFLVHSMVDNQSSYYQYRPRTEEEIENTQVISLAGVDLTGDLLRDVCAYNQSQQEYRIVVKDYGEDVDESDSEYYAKALDLFEDDLMDGIIPDVICMDGLPYQQLSNKGLLTDLAPMLENDERFDPSLYHMNILDGMKKGDKLERIGFSFVVYSMAAKTEIVGEQQGRTPEEYVKMIEDRPEDMEVFQGTTRDDILYYYLYRNQSAFIDKKTMTSNFASDSFVKLLELAGSLQPYDANANYVYDEPDKAFLNLITIMRPHDYHVHHAETFKMEDMTLVGLPDTSGGNGGWYEMAYTLALTSRSDKIDPVWEFIMEQLSSIRQSKRCMDNYEFNSLPIRRENLANCLLAATCGANRSYGNANEEEMAVLEAYIEGIRMYIDPDPFITSIIAEESAMYFSGDQTAERAAEMIQKRVNLYLSEQS